MSRLLPAAFLLAAAALLAFTVSAAHGLSKEYGYTGVDPFTAVIVLVLAALAFLLLAGARDPVGPARRSTVVLAVAVLLVFTVSTYTAARLGGAAYVQPPGLEEQDGILEDQPGREPRLPGAAAAPPTAR